LYTIHLHKLIFFAHHGLYQEEKMLGNEFEVSIDIELNHSAAIYTLEDTLNYLTVYNVIKEKMKQPERLLETLAGNIIDAVYLLDKRIHSIKITLFKINVPVKNFQGKIGITYQKSF